MADFNINEDAQGGFSGSQSSNNEEDASQPTGSAFPDEDEETITMLDVIEREDKLEEEASAVLGNSDEKNCTYPKGYLSRQALYSCATCSDGPDNMAAICLACSLECHDNHEVYELYTKRNYRCDCGNGRFKAGFECKLMDKQTKKAPENEGNKYNHNFYARYCICDKRYPPDEADDSPESQDEMWQCIVCEDWYHSKHIGVEDPPSKFEELICGTCVDKLEFIHHYADLDKLEDVSKPDDTSQSDAHDSIAGSGKPANGLHQDKVEPVSSFSPVASSSSSQSGVLTPVKTEQKPETSTTVCESDTNDSQAENKDPGNEASIQKQTSVDCILDRLKARYEKTPKEESSDKRPLFWLDCSWRSKLCRCQTCLDMYKAKECEYLLDDQDTVQYYEAQGKAMARTRASPFERGMTALNQMNRAAVVEALHGYDELKTDLSNYLRKFADSKKVVREEDIREFFDQLKSKKRPRLEFS